MKGNEWRVLRAKERTCFLFFRGLWSKINFNLFYTFLLCVCVLFYGHTDRCCDRCRINLMLYWERNGEASDKAKNQLHCRSPYLPLWWCYSSFVRRKMEKKLGKGKGRKLFKLLVLGSMGWRFLFVWKSQMLIFFFPIPTFSGHPNKTSFHFSHMESCFFFSLILYLSKRHY